MQSIFDESTRDTLIQRIQTLNENSKAQWGKMNIFQMLKHCTLWQELILGRKKHKRTLIGKLLGKFLLKKVLQDDKPMVHNTPTLPEFIIKENGNVELQKKEWIGLIGEMANFSNADFVHPFFGKMNKEQIGYLVYKHTDHHLRQFNA